MRALVFLITGITLSGCAGLMMGGGTSGKSPAETDRPTSSSQPADSAVADRVKSRYAADSVMRQFAVGVRSNGGMVTLSGTVPSYSARETAEKLAMATDGVKAVDNQIQVEYSK